MKRRDPFTLEREMKSFYKIRNVIKQIYTGNMIPGDKMKISTLAVPRHGFSDEKELAVLENWDYSKGNLDFLTTFVLLGKFY